MEPRSAPDQNLIFKGDFVMAVQDCSIRIQCRQCGEIKDISHFNKDASKLYGVRRICRPCHRSESKVFAEPRRDAYNQRSQIWYVENKERKQEYDIKNRPIYYQNNRAKMLAKTNRRRAAIRAHTPNWADASLIKAIYLAAAEQSVKTGTQYEVDHIVPILSKIVCGLHCEANLQILTSQENKKKKNVFWPDKP